MFRKKLLLFTFLIFLFTLCLNAYAQDSSQEEIQSVIDNVYAKDSSQEEIQSIIDDYFSYRQDSFFISQTSSKRATLERKIDSASIFSDEDKRKENLKKMSDKLGIKLVSARTTATIKDIKQDAEFIYANVYEWTFFDYTGEKDLVDTSGMGVNHELVFKKVDGVLKLIEDNYDEGPLTEMSSSTYKNPNKDKFNKDLQPKDFYKEKKPLTPEEKKKISKDDSEWVTASTYIDVVGVANYANNYVYTQANGGKYESYYNDKYWNCNKSGGPSNGGGDCGNYVSQCLYEGGKLSMVGKYTNNTSSWWYNFKNTSSTSDDSISDTWASAHYNRTFMMNNYGTVKNNPTDVDIVKGNPVYYEWHGSGSWYDHVTICVGTDSNGKPVVNSHNNDYYHVRWKYGYSDTYYSTVKIMNDDYGNALDSTAKTIYLNSSVAGTINYIGDVDCFKFTPSSSGTYTFQTTGSTDTYGYLYNSSKTKLASNDDSGEGYNFLISYNLTANSTYYIKVRHYDYPDDGTGSYTLKVTNN